MLMESPQIGILDFCDEVYRLFMENLIHINYGKQYGRYL